MRPPVSSVTATAPAKLNLHLAVGALRRDGYHDLTTVFHAVDVVDQVTVRTAPALSLVITGEGAPDLPTDHRNLAVRAVRLLAEETGCDPHVALLLDKRIPVAGGCAGGSADAAATLVACDALWGLELGKDELARIGARLGSDVPFSLHGGTALGTGRGEQLTPVLGTGTFAWVLGLADGTLSTPDVYAELDRLRADGRPPLVGDPSAVLAAVRKGSAVELGRALCNDLQDAAVSLRPGLRDCLEAGLELGALGAVVSGSGPTIAYLAEDDEHAAALASGLVLAGACRVALPAGGPAPGARVLRTA